MNFWQDKVRQAYSGGKAMNVRILWDLQEVDLALDRVAQDLHEVQEALQEPAVLRELREAIAAAEAEEQRLSVRQRDLELEIEALSERLRDLQERLYGGQITDFKEIRASQEKEAEMTRRRSTLEDELLEILVRLEEVRGQVRSLRERLAAEETTWASERERLLERQRALQEEQRALLRRRERLVASVEGELLRVYERLRHQKHGLAVAHLENRVCQTCGVEVPVSVDRQVRVGDTLVFCPTCGRILVA